MQWAPHVTVATVVEQDGRFLLVYENSDGQLVYNQPAGHWEEHETLLEAAIRETREETGCQIELIHILGISQYLSSINGFTYLRFTFVGRSLGLIPAAKLDTDIIEAVWLSYTEIHERAKQLRSPLVLNDINRYLRGERYPLELLSTLS